MALNTCLVLALAFALSSLLSAHAGDPDLTTDYSFPDGTTPKFVFRAFRDTLRGAPMDEPFTVKRASQVEFPALTGQSVSYAALRFAPNGINGPHTHPRSSELLLVLQGWLEVGFVDSENRLFSQVIEAGDVFVFPKGLMHFQVNRDTKYPALAIAAFGSSSPSTVVLQKALFDSGIGTDVLAKSFRVDAETIKKID